MEQQKQLSPKLDANSQIYLEYCNVWILLI